MSESVSLQAVSGVRCSDADRERTSERLRDAAAAGRLTMDELEDRLGGVYAARYRHELDTLVADLPQGARSRATGWLAVLAVAWAQLRVDLALLLGRGGSGWTRRRVVITVIVALFLIVVIISAIGGFAFQGGEHHGFENHGVSSGVGPRAGAWSGGR